MSAPPPRQDEENVAPAAPPSQSKSIGHYVLLKTIGEGTFGKVKLAQHVLTGESVAVKVLEKERMADVHDIERVAREIHILKLLRNPHVIQLYEIIETPRQLYLIMEYASGGELFDYIVLHGRATEQDACRFLHQILAGVEGLHETLVVHRDLKPENLLLDGRRDIKIADFGLSNTYDDGALLQTACGSPCYAAPEMVSGQKYVPRMVDVWSCGVILFALVCGRLPFEDENHAELYRKIMSAEYELPDYISSSVTRLIAGILTADPVRRMTIEDIRDHAWYRQMPEASIRVGDNAGELDEEVLEQLESYGFPRDHATRCLASSKHNHVTTTYYLLKEKRRSREAPQLDVTIADLDAAFAEPPSPPPPPPRMRMTHGGPLLSGRPVPRMTLDNVMQEYGLDQLAGGTAAMARAYGYDRRPATAPRMGGSARPPRQPSNSRGSLRRRFSDGFSGDNLSFDSRRQLHTPRGPREQLWAPHAAERRSSSALGWRGVAEPPLSARRRLPGGADVRHDWSLPPGCRAAQGRTPLSLTTRGGAEHRESRDAVLHVAYGARQPHLVIADVAQALSAQRIGCRHGSSEFLLCCHGRGARFEAEVFRRDGGSHVLRLLCVSGDIWRYKEICAQLLSDLRL
eukprot:NODE_1823_length_2366_cov_3.625279.p1 GENE.NODE_1823_length_2366_cov_3.625279~~NODE_1823_length_2366_cov_3.625279.p1  ORF type:complete len:630 (+),score=187.45 NODE_1823_length_2366_cov_3.625279:222-2111(+)